MPRDLASATVTKLEAQTVHIVELIQLHLRDSNGNDSILQLNTGPTDIVAVTPTSGTTLYTAQGQFLNFGSLKETADLSVPSFEILFTAVDTTTLAALVASDNSGRAINGRRAVFYRVVLDSSYNFSNDDVYMIFDGTIDGFSITQDDNTATLSLTCTSNFAKFSMINGVKTNMGSQQTRFPDDMGMEFASSIRQDIRWGQP